MSNCCMRRPAKFHVDSAVRFWAIANIREGGRQTPPPPVKRGLRNGELNFWKHVHFEVEYFLNEETEGVLTDTVIYFSDQHLTWLSQLKPNAKLG